MSRRRTAPLFAIGAVGLALGTAEVARAVPPPPSSSSAAAPSFDLESVLAPLGDASVETRRAAAKRASELGPEALPAIARALAEIRASNPGGVGAVVRALRDRHGARVNDNSFDLVEALISPPRGDAPSIKGALTVACLARSLARIGTRAAARQLVLIATDGGGAFRAEASRRMAELGDRALPALIEAKRNGDAAAWAAGMLESLGKHMPSDVVQTQDNQVLADVLRAYGAAKDLDAVRVILSFANSDRVQIRTAAREALLAYGNDGAWIVREAYAAAAGRPADEAWTGEQLDKALFEALDRARLQDVYALLDDGLAKQRAGQLEAAVQAFDKVLARQPTIDRRAEMVGGYVQYARFIEERDREGALTVLRKAERLDGDGPHAKEIESEIAYLEAEGVLARGVVDIEAFRRAVAIDPTNARASAELSRLEAERDAKASSTRWWTAAGGTLAALIAGVIVFAGRTKPKRRRGSLD